MKSTVPLVHWCIGDFQVAGRLTPLRRSYTISQEWNEDFCIGNMAPVPLSY